MPSQARAAVTRAATTSVAGLVGRRPGRVGPGRSCAPRRAARRRAVVVAHARSASSGLIGSPGYSCAGSAPARQVEIGPWAHRGQVGRDRLGSGSGRARSRGRAAGRTAGCPATGAARRPAGGPGDGAGSARGRRWSPASPSSVQTAITSTSRVRGPYRRCGSRVRPAAASSARARSSHARAGTSSATSTTALRYAGWSGVAPRRGLVDPGDDAATAVRRARRTAARRCA